MAKTVTVKRAARPRDGAEEITGLRALTQGGRTVYVPENADPSLFDDEALQSESAMSAALAGVLTELGARDDDAKVSVYRLDNVNGIRKEAFLYECHPNEFSMADLQEAYGAGDYRVKVYGLQADTNYKVIHANPKITIGPTREQAKKALLPVVLAAAPAAPADAGIAAALALLAQAVHKMSESSGGTRAELLAEMKTMAEIAGLNRPAGGELAGIQGALALMTSLKGVMGGGAGGVDNDPDAAPYQLMGKALETFSEIYKTARAVPAAAPEVPKLPAPPASGKSADAPGEFTLEDEALNIMLKGQLMTLLFAGRANDDPEKWGARIYEDAPDEIIAAIQSPDWFEQVVKLDANFSTLKPWLEKVRAVVLEEITAAGTALTGAAGPATNAASGSRAPDVALSGSDKPA